MKRQFLIMALIISFAIYGCGNIKDGNIGNEPVAYQSKQNGTNYMTADSDEDEVSEEYVEDSICLIEEYQSFLDGDNKCSTSSETYFSDAFGYYNISKYEGSIQDIKEKYAEDITAHFGEEKIQPNDVCVSYLAIPIGNEQLLAVSFSRGYADDIVLELVAANINGRIVVAGENFSGRGRDSIYAENGLAIYSVRNSGTSSSSEMFYAFPNGNWLKFANVEYYNMQVEANGKTIELFVSDYIINENNYCLIEFLEDGMDETNRDMYMEEILKMDFTNNKTIVNIDELNQILNNELSSLDRNYLEDSKKFLEFQVVEN